MPRLTSLGFPCDGIRFLRNKLEEKCGKFTEENKFFLYSLGFFVKYLMFNFEMVEQPTFFKE